MEVSTSFLSALRPWTFTASLTPVVLGSVLAYRSHGLFQWHLLLLSLGAVLAVNGAGNIVNTYFDSMRKHSQRTSRRDQQAQTDQDGRVTTPATSLTHLRRRAIQHQQSHTEEEHSHYEQTQLVNYAAYLYGSGMACLWLLIWCSPAKSEFLAGMFFGGLSSSFLYTGGVGLKYYILGDLVVMFTFGPLSVLFSYGVQCGEFPLGPLFLALPLAFSTEAILHCKHLRQMDEDSRAGVLSLAVLLGQQGSYFLFTLLLFVPYLIFVLLATQFSLTMGFPLLTMPFAFRLERGLRDQGPTHSISTTAAKLNFAVSVLFVFGCLLATQLPFINTNTKSPLH